ncbi:hypothetical protein OQA88_11888 [Cercophora sp. LCS_1]
MSATQDPRRPLGPREIRLLKLHPGNPEDMVRCSIVVASLDSTPPPQYEALSYTWGSPEAKETIIVDGFHMLALKNLHTAMRHLRYRLARNDSGLGIEGSAVEKNEAGNGVEIQDPPVLRNETRGLTRIIWADAICIKQDDTREREMQVQLMGDVYRLSSRGVIWLGEASGNTERAFMMAFWLCKVAYHQVSKARGGGGTLQHRGSSLEVYGKPSFKVLMELDNVQIKWSMCLCWKALQALVSREWFFRAWVVQEATLARDISVVCGHYSIPWSELVVALRCAPSIPIRPLGGMPLPSHVAVIERLRREIAGNKTSLQDILLRNSSCKATVPMDRVYAFLGLVQRGELKDFGLDKPNYSTWDFKHLCRQVVIGIINKSGNLGILSGPVGNTRSRDGWPSWVPDWEADQRPKCLTLDNLFDASLSKQSRVEVLVDERTFSLGVQGFVLDNVDKMTRITDKTAPSTWTFTEYHTYKTRMEGMVEFLQQCLEWENVTGARSGAKYPGTGEPILDAYWKTLLGGHVTSENEERQAKEFSRFDMISKDGAQILQTLGLPAWPWIMLLTPHNISRLFLRALVTRRDVAGLLGRIGDFTSNPNFAFVLNRRLVRTTNGYIGLAPASTRVGDKISLIKGASVPFIVRQKGNKWELVGECYIHGVMSGEAWDPRKMKEMWVE